MSRAKLSYSLSFPYSRPSSTILHNKSD